MNFLLDTDHISILQKQSGPEYAHVSARISQVNPDDVAYCIVSFHEQVLGCQSYLARARSSTDVLRGYEILDLILATFSAAPVLPFDGAASILLDHLKSQRIRVPTMDLRIASIALSQGMTLLTRNTRDFSKVPGLLIEDWTT